MKRPSLQTRARDTLDPSSAIDQIVSALLEEEAAHGAHTDTEIQERFPDQHEQILPALRDGRAISAAAERARQLREDSADFGAKSSSQEDLSLLQQSLPGFEILQWVGSGGQGAVYRAIQKSTHRTVALKILLGSRVTSSNHTNRFSREVEIASQLQHPNIVGVYDSGFVLGRPYFAMEFVDGMSIDDFIQTHRPTIEERVRLFIEVCKAVSYAHQRGVIHRDLKSANVLVDLDSKPHVLDFGLAKCFDDTLGMQDDWNVSLPGQVVGTLPYLSPEQALGKPNDVDTRSDVYSLGVILYQILTGALPYPLDGTPDTLRGRIAKDDPMSFRQSLARAELPAYDSEVFLPDDLEQVVRKALAKDKDRRYQSVDALAEDLSRFLAGQAVDAKADSAMYVLRKTVRRYRVQFAVAGAFVLVLILALGGMFVLWQRADRLASEYQRSLLAGSYLRMASVERDEGRLDDAIAMFDKAVELSEMISDPDDSVLHWRFDAHHRLAELLIDAKKLSAAEPHVAAALALAKQRVNANPEDAAWRRLLGFAYRVKGRLETTERKFEAALGSLRESRKLRETLVREYPTNSSLRAELAFTYKQLGSYYRELKKLGEAGPYYKSAVEIQEQLYRDDPLSLDRTIDLSFSEQGLAAWYMDCKNDDSDRQAQEIYKDIEKRLSKCKNTEKGPLRSRDIDQILDAVRTNLKKIDRRLNKDPHQDS